MKILVIAATGFEIQIFRETFPHANICITGVGSAHTAYHLLKAINKEKFDWVLQCGVAGTFDDHIPLGTTVVVEKDCFADLGANEKNGFQTLDDLGLMNKDYFPYKNNWLINENLTVASSDLPKASAITVNLVSEDKVWIKRLHDTYQPDVESMEGAALHYVCNMEGIPFVQIRGISNRVGDRNKSNWKMKEAIESSNEALIHIYNQLL